MSLGDMGPAFIFPRTSNPLIPKYAKENGL